VSKPKLIVCCPDPHPDAGSEPGKAFAWTRALATRFEVHVFCLKTAAANCKRHPDSANWVFHEIEHPYPHKNSFFSFYCWYKRWCDLLIPEIQAKLEAIKPVGLHHPTLGSFRILPRYDVLGIKYTLGPLGGGEYVPASFAISSHLPIRELCKELTRPGLNTLCAVNPWVAPILKNASHTLATTPQTAHLLTLSGCRSVSTVFPDVFVSQLNTKEIILKRQKQMSELHKECRLLFSARALWWKGGHLAILVLKCLRENGMNAILTMITQGKAEAAWRQIAQESEMEQWITWSHFVPREQLLEIQSSAHAFVYPTMHDSSSSALPEAYSTGLPSVTLGIGGIATAAGSGTGMNEYFPNAQQWINQAAAHISNWTSDPELWLLACQASLERSFYFNPSRLEMIVQEKIAPVF